MKTFILLSSKWWMFYSKHGKANGSATDIIILKCHLITMISPLSLKKNPGRTAIHITYAILHKPRLRTFFWTAFYPPHGRIQDFFGRVGSLLSLVSPWDAIVVGNEVKISKISLSRLVKIAFIRFFLYISCVPSLPSILLSS